MKKGKKNIFFSNQSIRKENKQYRTDFVVGERERKLLRFCVSKYINLLG